MSIYNPKYECMKNEDKRVLQSERLISLVKNVYENVACYRKKMDDLNLKPSDIKSIEDISKLPFTTKQDLRDNYPFGMFAAKREEIVRIHASSGTTGKLTVVGYTQNDIDVWSEVMARALVTAGATKKSTVHVSYGYGLFTGGLGAHYGAEKLGSTVVPVGSGNTKRQLMLLKDFEADVMCCTPSYALHLADEIEKEGYKLSDFSLKVGLFGAEPWTNEMRNEIERRLNIKAYDIYGLSEIIGPGVAIECEERNGSHIFEDHFYPEIIDSETGEVLPYGEEGELVFTTLTKEGIPLIRYRTKDITSLINEPCECGRNLIRMNKVVGRTDDMLIIGGVNVFPSQIEAAILNCGKGVTPHYMIYVDRVGVFDKLRVEIELSEELLFDEVRKIEEQRAVIESEINSMIGISAKVKLVEPNSIARSEGKAKRVIDNRNN